MVSGTLKGDTPLLGIMRTFLRKKRSRSSYTRNPKESRSEARVTRAPLISGGVSGSTLVHVGDGRSSDFPNGVYRGLRVKNGT